jgi:4-hydroxy-3-methylbut-2-en-1-yl diphosphate synthase IspG/GcpE
MPRWKHAYEGVETLTLAVMGCVVNGPANRRRPTSASACRDRRSAELPVYVDGEHVTTLRGTYEELATGFRASSTTTSPRDIRRRTEALFHHRATTDHYHPAWIHSHV